jgi:8-oxo-dGTP pyrophosphatase MutT (NUDIX family)
MFIYNWPMSSIGVGAFYYYKKDQDTILLLQKRSEKMFHAPGEIDVTGGYSDTGIEQNGNFESLPESLIRETGEEIGWDFVNALPKNPFTMKNIALIRQKSDIKFDIDPKGFLYFRAKLKAFFQNIKPKQHTSQQMNFSFIWVLEVSEETAHKAIIADPDEVAELVHINMKDIQETPLVRPWIKEHIPTLIHEGYFHSRKKTSM